MFFGKQDFKKEIIEAIEKGEIAKVKKLSIKAFEKEIENENLLGFICGVIFEHQILDLKDLFFTFREKYPFSLYPVRVFISDLLVRVNKFDDATNESRFYLRAVLENKQLESPQNESIKYYIGKAFYLTTCVYTQIGARSYSQYVINYANLFISEKWNNEHWTKVYSDEIERLKKELQEENNKLINAKWNKFFKAGENSSELYELCMKNNHKLMAKRVDLIESNFRFNPDYKVDHREFFKLISEDFQEGKKTYVLR